MANAAVKWVCGTAVLVALVGAGTAVFVVGRVAEVAGQWGGWTKVSEENRLEVTAGLSAIRAMKKLVVMQASVDVDVERSRTKRWLGESVYLGTTTVRLRARDNRVQYVIPLASTGAQDLTFDAGRGVMQVRVPRPELDREMVSVQADPSKVELRTDVGWASLDCSAGETLRTEVKAALRDEVVKSASHSPLVQEKAESLGREMLTSALGDAVSKAAGRRVGVEVIWE
jgi:hypothetical protein